MATNITIMNTVWNNASTNYQDRIPLATRDNVTAVGNAILTYDVAKNEFLDALVNRISLVTIASKMAKNKLGVFKKGMLEFGADIEEIFVSMAQANHFDVSVAESEVFKRKQPDVKAMFHRVNREDFYKVTIEDAQLKRAFLSNDGLGKLVSSIINSLYSGDNYDEYVLMKELFAQYQNNYAYVEVPKVIDQDTALDFFRAVRQVSTDMTFMSTKFNKQGVKQYTERGDQILFLHKNVDTFLNTDLLSWVFNKENVDFNTQVVILDDFGSMADTQAVLVDRNWFMVYDKLFETRNQYNSEGMYTNYWLHHHQLLSTSQFQNAVRFSIPSA